MVVKRDEQRKPQNGYLKEIRGVGENQISDGKI